MRREGFSFIVLVWGSGGARPVFASSFHSVSPRTGRALALARSTVEKIGMDEVFRFVCSIRVEA